MVLDRIGKLGGRLYGSLSNGFCKGHAILHIVFQRGHELNILSGTVCGTPSRVA